MPRPLAIVLSFAVLAALAFSFSYYIVFADRALISDHTVHQTLQLFLCDTARSSDIQHGHGKLAHILARSGVDYRTGLLLHSFAFVFLFFAGLWWLYLTAAARVATAWFWFLLTAAVPAPVTIELFTFEDDIAYMGFLLLFIWAITAPSLSRIWSIVLAAAFISMAFFTHAIALATVFILASVPFDLAAGEKELARRKVFAVPAGLFIAWIVHYIADIGTYQDLRYSTQMLKHLGYAFSIRRLPFLEYPSLVSSDFWINYPPKGFYYAFFNALSQSTVSAACFYGGVLGVWGGLWMCWRRRPGPVHARTRFWFVAQMFALFLFMAMVYEPEQPERWLAAAVFMNVILLHVWLYCGPRGKVIAAAVLAAGWFFAFPIMVQRGYLGTFYFTPPEPLSVARVELEELKARFPKGYAQEGSWVLPDKYIKFDVWFKSHFPGMANHIYYRISDHPGKVVHLRFPCLGVDDKAWAAVPKPALFGIFDHAGVLGRFLREEGPLLQQARQPVREFGESF